MITPDLRPAADWAAHFGVKILDPDGWRQNDGVDWETPIDEEDFRERYAMSTVQNLSLNLTPVPSAREAILREMQREVREINTANGWYESDRTFGEDVALLHSEVSEMLEAYRDNGLEDFSGLQFRYDSPQTVRSATTVAALSRFQAHQNRLEAGSDRVEWEGFTREELLALAADGVSKPEGVGSEAADILVRLLDTVDRNNIDLAWEFARKLAYNRTRGRRHGGKRL